jgi:hypothetical protein
MPGTPIASALPAAERRGSASSALAIRIDRRDDALLGALALTIATIWIAAGLSALIAHRPAVLSSLGAAGACPVLLVGAAFALWALDMLIRRQTLVSGNGEIEVTTRRLTGVRRWREPVASYIGLRHRHEPVRHRYGRRTEHRIELAHPDPARTVVLLRSWDEARAEACWRDWAHRLNLPTAPGEGSGDRRSEGAHQGPRREPQSLATA